MSSKSMAAKTSRVEALGPAWQKPARLRRGDAIAVIAPSGPVPQTRLWPGMSVLSPRYETVFSDGLVAQRGFLAGEDGRRWAELVWAMSDPQVHGIFCARGGHGALRLLPQLLALTPHEFPHRPLVGFSDITVLHAFWALHKRISVHGPVVTQLAELPADDQAALFALLEDPAPPPAVTDLVLLTQASHPAQGRLLGGNLEVLSRLCGTPLQRMFQESGPIVLLLEEVTEAPYRIDRALTHLIHAGAFAHVQAVVLGELLRCEGPSEHPSALDVLSERIGSLGLPLLSGLPLGHGARNRAVPLGVAVSVDPRRGVLTFLEPAVRS